MKLKSNQILNLMNVLSWIVCIGLLIKAGAILISFIVSRFFNPEGAKNLYLGLDLSDLLAYSSWHYTFVVLFIICLLCLKAYLFYVLIILLKKINFIHPFSIEVNSLIKRVSYIALGIGIIALMSKLYYDILITKGVALNSLQSYIDEGSGFLFLAGIVFIIAQVFNRGIEIQTENEETV